MEPAVLPFGPAKSVLRQDNVPVILYLVVLGK